MKIILETVDTAKQNTISQEEKTKAAILEKEDLQKQRDELIATTTTTTVITEQTIVPIAANEEVAGEAAQKDKARMIKNRGRGKDGKKKEPNNKSEKEKQDAGEILTTKVVDDTVFKNPTVMKYKSEAATKRKEATRIAQAAKFVKS